MGICNMKGVTPCAPTKRMSSPIRLPSKLLGLPDSRTRMYPRREDCVVLCYIYISVAALVYTTNTAAMAREWIMNEH